jgi:hypothetical protein
VEKTAQRKMFATTVEDRQAVSLLHVIARFVKRGSIIHTDCFAPYNGLADMGMDYIHKTVNHSREFITNEGVHTNTIEGTWNGIKMSVPARNRTAMAMPWKLVEFIWRRLHADHWEGLLSTLGEVSFAPLVDAVEEENGRPQHLRTAPFRRPTLTALRRADIVDDAMEEDDVNWSVVLSDDGDGDSGSEADDSDDEDYEDYFFE